MTDQTESRIIHPRSINPIWYAAAVVICVIGLGLFYVLQTTGFSDPNNGFSIDMSDPLNKVSEG